MPENRERQRVVVHAELWMGPEIIGYASGTGYFGFHEDDKWEIFNSLDMITADDGMAALALALREHWMDHVELYGSFFHLERLEVREGCRGVGYGKTLFREMAALMLGRFRCSCLLARAHPMEFVAHGESGDVAVSASRYVRAAQRLANAYLHWLPGAEAARGTKEICDRPTKWVFAGCHSIASRA